MRATVEHIKSAPANWFYLPQYVYIGRRMPHIEDTGYYGNPYRLKKNEDRGATLELFEAYARRRIEKDPEYRARVAWLHGKILLCWCSPKPCHGEVLAKIAAELASSNQTGSAPSLSGLPSNEGQPNAPEKNQTGEPSKELKL